MLSQLNLLLVRQNLRDHKSPEKTVANHRELLRLIRAGDESAAVAHVARGGEGYRLQALSK
jgi:hypothetical protein